MSWPIVALLLGVVLAFTGLKLLEQLSGSRDGRSRPGSSRAAGAGSLPARAPRRRTVDWELIAHGQAARWDDRTTRYVKGRLSNDPGPH